MPKSTLSSTELDRSSADPMPVFLFLCGRGKSGKSFLTRIIVERAQAMGRDPAILDADRTNPTTKQFFPGALQPTAGNELAMQNWLEDHLQEFAYNRKSCVVDFGANDAALRQAARETDLVAFFAELNIRLVIMHLVGSDLDDLNYLTEYEMVLDKRRLFAPPGTILCLNAGASNQDDITKAFKPIAEHPAFTAALERGAKPLVIPYLRQGTNLARRRLLFKDLGDKDANGNLNLGLLDQHKVREWRRVVDVRLDEISELLP